jgi:RimJ/RimL family protein N-acetyltransferase
MENTIELRPVAESDLPTIYKLTNDPEFTGEFEWYGWHDQWHFQRLWKENGLLYADGGVLSVRVGEDTVGFVSWRKQMTGQTTFCWAMGVAMLPEARGKGYGTAAQRQLVRYLFMHSLVNRIEAGTEISNVAEQRALEKAGFTREGVMRGAAFQGGRWHDAVIYSVLRAEADLGVNSAPS